MRKVVGSWVFMALVAFAQKPNAPEKLQPPADAPVILHAFGKGDQVYTCGQKDGKFAWTFKEPEARLTGEDGNEVGRHFAGPTWAASDGSRVVGKVIATVPSPDPNSIPWLLLTATENVGSGRMSHVKTIQRLNTQAGKAPESPCDSARAGNVVRVPYSAEYWFYGK